MTKKLEDKRRFWTLDCETDPFQHGRVPRPFLWGIYNGDQFFHFSDIGPLVEFIRDQNVILFAHNGGKFDFHFLLGEIEKHIPIKVITGRLVSANIGRTELRDSWSVLPIPLAQYQKTKVDYAIFEASERDKPHNAKIILDYLRDDCVDLYSLVEAFEGYYGRHLTQASASAAMWRKISGRNMPKSSESFFHEFSPYYFGGRVQCFKKGYITGPVRIIDKISAYPHAMLSPHPYEPEYVTIDSPKNFLPTSMLTVECVSNGALPYRNEHGSITFPTDREKRRYYATGHEILAGLDTGCISHLKISQAIDFNDTTDFAEFIQHFYALRRQAKADGDKAQDIFCKLLMNSLYGKFAANPDNYGNYMVCDFDEIAAFCFEDAEQRHIDPDNEKDRARMLQFDGMLGPNALLRSPLEPWQRNYINVATAASITGQVRAGLWRAIKAAGEVFYCDTDSIFCREPDVDFGKDLGQWTDEGTADELYIAGKKLYVAYGDFGKDNKGKLVTEKKACKGVNLTGEEIKKAATGHTVTARAEAPTFRLHSEPMFQVRNIKMT